MAAANAYRKRQKESYGILSRHVLDLDLVSAMRSDSFQLGFESFTNLQHQCSIPIDMLRLRDLDRQWNDLDILNDIGVNEHTIQTLCKRLRAMNGKRPAIHRKDLSQLGERLLECIFTTSKHFSEGAIVEYNANIQQRQFELQAPHPQAGHTGISMPLKPTTTPCG